MNLIYIRKGGDTRRRSDFVLSWKNDNLEICIIHCCTTIGPCREISGSAKAFTTLESLNIILDPVE